MTPPPASPALGPAVSPDGGLQAAAARAQERGGEEPQAGHRRDVQQPRPPSRHRVAAGAPCTFRQSQKSWYFSFTGPHFPESPPPQGKHGELERYSDPVKPSPPSDDYYDHLMEASDDQRLDLPAQRPDHGGRDLGSQQLQQQLRPASSDPPHLKQQQQLPEIIG